MKQFVSGIRDQPDLGSRKFLGQNGQIVFPVYGTV